MIDFQFVIDIQPVPFSYFVNKLEKKESFSVLRFGDGEFLCMLGHPGANCDGAKYTLDLANGLIHALDNRPEYYIGTTPKLKQQIGDNEFRNTTFCDKFAELHKHIKWFNSDIIQEANWEGKLKPFVDILRNRDIMFVVPLFLQKSLHSLFPKASFFIVDGQKASEQISYVVNGVRSWFKGISNGIVLFSCGMASNVMIDHLWNEFGKSIAMINVGSIWDVYAGHESRWHFEAKNKWKDWNLLFHLNFGTDVNLGLPKIWIY